MKNQLDCILLIDDDEADNFFNEMTIKKVGCAKEVVIAEDGAEAMKYLASVENQNHLRPALIFLDINMPGMDGWEFLEEYEKLDEGQRSQIVLVMLSTSLNPEDEERARDNPIITDFIRKPLTETSIIEILQEHFPDVLG